MAYKTVAKTHERTELIKGSRFIAFVCQVLSLDDVASELQRIRAKYPDASHHCYAYKLAKEQRFSDDGEPGGSAGRPMLEVLERRGLDFVLAVVSRYFGGSKLGVGGLLRAYSGSLAKALDEAGSLLIKDRVGLHFEVPFSAMDSVHRYLNAIPELRKDELAYNKRGMELRVNLLSEDEERVRKELLTISRGELSWYES